MDLPLSESRRISGFRLVFAFPLFVGAMFGISSSSCQQKTPQAAKNETPTIPVSQPVQRKVAEYVEYTGRTDAKESVSVRARVTGYLIKVHFKEGTEVKKDDPLFDVDPRPYQAAVDQAESQLVVNQTSQKFAKDTYDRDKGLGMAVSQQQLDQDKAALASADAQVKKSKAALDAANLNLSFTTVKAPIGGRISRTFYTVGNLVSQDQTLLTTIVSMNPIYVYFDMDERTCRRFVSDINDGKIEVPSENSNVPIEMALEGELGFPNKGKIDFINNQVNPSTGTVAVRALFDNERPDGGLWRLSGGMFVRIRLPLGDPRPALLVIDKAIGSDQGLKFVYVVDSENRVQYRRVETGAIQDDGRRVIEPYDEEKDIGLKPGDWVVVGGLQQLRPKTIVKPDKTEMPIVKGEAPTTNRSNPQPPPPVRKK